MKSCIKNVTDEKWAIDKILGANSNFDMVTAWIRKNTSEKAQLPSKDHMM